MNVKDKSIKSLTFLPKLPYLCMMKSLFTIILVLTGLMFTNNTSAQELFVIGSSGGYSEGASHNLSWTMGEVIVTTATAVNHDATQGFHQPDVHVLSVEEYKPLDISVYPNPARDIINIESSENSKLSIYDIQGKFVDTMDITSNTTSIDMSYLSRGTYTLVFEANGGLAKRMKIVIL